MRVWVLEVIVLSVLLLATTVEAQSPEIELAEKQWGTVYDFRRASQTKTCTVSSLEAPITVLLIDRVGERHHLLKIGSEVVPGTDAWIRIGNGESRRFAEGLIPTTSSFALVSDMLLGAYAYVEWTGWPDRRIHESQSGLGFFAWSYALCRSKLGWSVPKSLQSILDERYEQGPDLENPFIPTREEVDQKNARIIKHYLELLEKLEELVSGQ